MGVATRGRHQSVRLVGFRLGAFQASTQFTVPTGKQGTLRGLLRGMPLVTRIRMEKLHANMSGIQWHPRVYIPVEKRAPHNNRNPMMLTLTRQNPW
jgi:hypothetical protein